MRTKGNSCMRDIDSERLERRTGFWPALLALLLAWPAAAPGATQSAKLPVVPKWTRFQQTFKSRVPYTNAFQQASLQVFFRSPVGQTNVVYGFWDGGDVWRVRFSPDQPGRWLYTTVCSDASNSGLHNQSGQFLCTAALGQLPFHLHGPLRVGLNHRHFEHADGLPFFWLADGAWDGARMAEPRDWSFYAYTRADQKFNVVQWTVAPGADFMDQLAFAGDQRIWVNPAFFQQLDGKVETLSRAGLVSAIVPLWDTANPALKPLPDDQAALLVRYIVARFGADPVVWLLPVPAKDPDHNSDRWKNIGRAVFPEIKHAPVIVYVGNAMRLLDDFRGENWVGGLAYKPLADLTEDSLKRSLHGLASLEWTKEPALPLIPFLPCENGPTAGSAKPLTTDELRRSAFWSLLLAPPAGVSYCAEGIPNWNTTVEAVGESAAAARLDLPVWQKALFLPGAEQMKQLAHLMESMQFWRLVPQLGLVATQSGSPSLRRYIAAAGTEDKNLGLVYVPEDRSVDVSPAGLPSPPAVTWFNPRTGEISPAPAVIAGGNARFPTPDSGDWLLVMRVGKR
jgi:uncharacterized protein DUF4038/uncharacterized protein DUF5060/collagenase-like protein with putative collagen-binding domain